LNLNRTQYVQTFLNLNATTNLTIGFVAKGIYFNGQNYSLGYRTDTSLGIDDLQLVDNSFTTDAHEVAFEIINTTQSYLVTRDYPDSIANTTASDIGVSWMIGNNKVVWLIDDDNGGVEQVNFFGNTISGLVCDSIANNNCISINDEAGSYIWGFNQASTCSVTITNDVRKRLTCSGGALENINITTYEGTDYIDVDMLNTGSSAQVEFAIMYDSSGELWTPLDKRQQHYANGTNYTTTVATVTGFSDGKNVSVAINLNNYTDYTLWGKGGGNSGNLWAATPTTDTNQHIGKSGVNQGGIVDGDKFGFRWGFTDVNNSNNDNTLNGVRGEIEWQKYMNDLIITASPQFSTSITGNSAPTFTSGYPQINSTDSLQRNSTIRNLSVTFIATDQDNQTDLRYSITFFRNNLSNFSYLNVLYTNNTFINSIITTPNLTVGDTWKAQVNITDGINIITSNTSELLLINSAPTIPNINYPMNNLMTANYSNLALSCNGSTDLEGDSIKYEYYTEREVDPPTINNANTTNDEINYTLGLDGRYYWRCRASDTLNTTSGYNSTRSFLVDRRIITRVTNTFNSDVFQGTNQTYSTNVTLNLTVAKDINATLVNGTTILNTHKEQLENNKFRFTTSRLAPGTDQQYFWNFTILQNNNTIVYNTTHSFTQIVSVQSLYDCTSAFTNSSSMLLMNYTLKNEENKTVLNGDWEGNFIRYFNDITFNTSFVFGLKTNVTNVKICSSPANASFKIDGTIRYQGLDPGTGTRLQDPRNYLFYKDNAGNNTGVLDIPLYLLDFAKANAIKFTLVDTSDVGIQNGIIKVQRYYPGNNTYETVAMGRTDQNGETVIFLRLNDVTHRLIVVFPSGETKDYGDVIFSGSTYKITSTSISPIKKLFDFDYVTTSITFDNSSKTFLASYQDTNPSATDRIVSGCFAVTRLTLNQTDNVVYNRCTLASTGNFEVYVGNGSYQYNALLYANRNPSSVLEQIYVDLTSHILGNNLGKEGVFFTLIIMLSLVMLGLFKPEIAVVMSILGIIISVMLGFLILTYATLVAFVISGAMYIYRISKR